MARKAKGSGDASRPATAQTNALTPREMEILYVLAEGLTYSQVAERLKMSKQTVPVHVKSIYRKLEANSRSEAVYKALRRGLIRL